VSPTRSSSSGPVVVGTPTAGGRDERMAGRTSTTCVPSLATTRRKAYREGKPSFPDDTIIARLAWRDTPSEENNKTFGRAQSFVAGAPVNGVQFMVKDSKKYASTGGWKFTQFDDGKPLEDEAKLSALLAVAFAQMTLP
jgi:cytochrome P460